MKNLFLIFFTLIFLSCKNEKAKVSESADSDTIADFSEIIPETKTVSKENILKHLNDEIIESLKEKNYEKFTSFIHPEKGVRFSMYAYVNAEENKVFSQEEFSKYINTNIKFTFGERDGTGDLYIISLKKYLENWVFKRDFSNAEFHLNEFKGHGNSLNNLKEVYPNSDFTENYIPGSEKYGGMDWNSLRFVFEKFGEKYYLIAVINDEWTI